MSNLLVGPGPLVPPLKRYEVHTRDAEGNHHWVTVDATTSRGAVVIAKRKTNAVHGTCTAYLGPVLNSAPEPTSPEADADSPAGALSTPGGATLLGSDPEDPNVSFQRERDGSITMTVPDSYLDGWRKP